VLSTFLIALREGLEASLIVSILIAYLARTGNAVFARYIWLGVSGAVGLSFGLGAFLSFTSTNLSPRGEALFAGITSVASVAFVTIMVFWMKRTARGLGRELQNRVDGALPLGAFALISTAFFAVAREGLETALFIYANFRTVRSNTAPSIGLFLGLATAITLGALIYRKTVKINLGKFFSITGYGLIIVAAGVLSHAVSEFQSRGNLPGGSAFAWNATNGSGPFWSIIDGSLGIGSAMTWLQLVVWAIYIGTVASLYRRPLKVSPPLEPARAS
jgi:high-affinity iron transporter